MLIFEFLITKNWGVGLNLFRRRYRSTWKSFDYKVGRGWDQKNIVTFEIFVRMFIVELSMACVHVCSILGCQSLKESRKRTKAWTSSLGQFQEKAALCFDLRFE